MELSTTIISDKNSIHTQEFLKGGKRLQCIWCSRANFVERKTSLRYLEYKKGSCKNHCWSHYGVPVVLKCGAKKRKIVSKDWEWNESLFFFVLVEETSMTLHIAWVVNGRWPYPRRVISSLGNRREADTLFWGSKHIDCDLSSEGRCSSTN